MAAIVLPPLDEEGATSGYALERVIHRGTVPMVVMRRPDQSVLEVSPQEAVALLADDGDTDDGPSESAAAFVLLDDFLLSLNLRQGEAAGFRLAAQSLVFDGYPVTHTALGQHLHLAPQHLARFAQGPTTPSPNIALFLDLVREGHFLPRHARRPNFRVSRASLYEWRCRAGRDGGPAHLTDERQVRHYLWLVGHEAQELMVHIRAYALAEATGPDRDLTKHMARCYAHLGRVATPILDRASRRRVEWLMKRVLRQALLHVKRDTRESMSVHVPTDGLGFRPSGPRQIIQIDATVLKAHALDIHGHHVPRAEVIVAIDMWNREFLDLIIVPGTPKAADVRALLARLLLRTRESIEPEGNLLRLPSALSLTGEWDVEAITSMLTDRGSNIVATSNLELLASEGVSVGLAPPGRGDTKGAVEAFIRAVSRSLQLLPGYTGRSGKGPRSTLDNESLLQLAEIETLLRAWGHFVYNRRPHSGLRIDGTRIAVSPYAMLRAWDSLYGLPVRSISFEEIKPFLRVQAASLTNEGLLLDGEHYLDMQGHLLDLRGRVAG